MSECAFAPFVQLHLLTFYPPSNLNRDDQGRPKTAVVGGFERQRVSSQALKRAWRTSDVFKVALEGHLASRTQRIGGVIYDHLIKAGADAVKALEIASELAGVFGKVKDDKKDGTDPKVLTRTEQLAFISPQERELAIRMADARLAGTADKVLPKQILLAHDTAADVAMFGRMLASNAEFNREAAVAVAHAITTHRVIVEDDYYTAVDDLKEAQEDAGAGFIGEAAFGSGVFYLYIVENLGGDQELAAKTISALVTAAATIGPRGKVASYASFARTSFILAERGFASPRTLASAFVQPVDKIAASKGFLAASIAALQETQDNFAKAYPEDVIETAFMDVGAAQGTLSDILNFCVDGLQ